ncbi:MAG: LysM peptidoglycan-binding domain-containing protein [Candidatus Schekmanbacteria bacterium]|nr:LysM peptidoglycan-binding domain-containing protein [Candidatus Schekmanbacteria bacterium]
MRIPSREARLALVLLVAVATVATAAVAADIASRYDSVAYGGVTYYFPKRDTVVIPADIPASHTVVRGDTLWDIAGTYLKDPFLWPLIWEVNLETVANPHLIFPDQVIKLPVGQATAPAVASEGGTGEEGAGGEAAGAAPVPHPVAWSSAMESSGYIADVDDDDEVGVGAILAADGRMVEITEGDIVFVNIGSDNDVEPGDEFSILSIDRKVKHPVNGDSLGRLILEKGRIKVLCVQEETATARVVRAYTNIRRGDRVAPFTPVPVPTSLETSTVEVCPPRTDKVAGYIVEAKETIFGASDAAVIGKDSTVYIDLGADDSVTPGDYFRIFQAVPFNDELPPIKKGELVVLKVQGETATALVVHSTGPMYVGDQIEMK